MGLALAVPAQRQKQHHQPQRQKQDVADSARRSVRRLKPRRIGGEIKRIKYSKLKRTYIKGISD